MFPCLEYWLLGNTPFEYGGFHWCNYSKTFMAIRRHFIGCILQDFSWRRQDWVPGSVKNVYLRRMFRLLLLVSLDLKSRIRSYPVLLSGNQEQFCIYKYRVNSALSRLLFSLGFPRSSDLTTTFQYTELISESRPTKSRKQLLRRPLLIDQQA